jgi:hypothetical protein
VCQLSLPLPSLIRASQIVNGLLGREIAELHAFSQAGIPLQAVYEP